MDTDKETCIALAINLLLAIAITVVAVAAHAKDKKAPTLPPWKTEVHPVPTTLPCPWDMRSLPNPYRKMDM